MFGTDPLASLPWASMTDPSTYRQGGIIAYVSTVAKVNATNQTLPRENATVNTQPNR